MVLPVELEPGYNRMEKLCLQMGGLGVATKGSPWMRGEHKKGRRLGVNALSVSQAEGLSLQGSASLKPAIPQWQV
jgi:hypothetical protein